MAKLTLDHGPQNLRFCLISHYYLIWCSEVDSLVELWYNGCTMDVLPNTDFHKLSISRSYLGSQIDHFFDFK